MCLKHQSTLTMTQARLTQHNSFPGDQKHGPDIAGSKITADLEAGEGGWKAHAGSRDLGSHKQVCGENRAGILKFGLTETKDKPRVSLSLLENKR